MLSPRHVLLLALCVNGWAFLANSAATPVEVLVDGVSAELRGNTVKVPKSAKGIAFRLGDSGEMRRVRYLLEGVDRGWVQRTEAMSVHVRFIDKAGDQLLHEIYPVRGISSGWRTTIENSTFIHRRQTLVVPPDLAGGGGGGRLESACEPRAGSAPPHRLRPAAKLEAARPRSSDRAALYTQGIWLTNGEFP